MNFEFSIKKNKKKYDLKIFISDGEVSLDIGKFKYEDFTENFFDLINEYKSHNGIGGVSYTQRELINRILHNSGNNEEIELLRIMGCSFSLLNYELKVKDVFVSDWIKKKIENKDSHLFEKRLYIDWKDELGPQPSIYYLSSEIINSNGSELNKIFELGIVGKLFITDENDNKTFFFTPFTFPKISNLDYMIHKQIINKVMIERENNMKNVGK